MPQNRFPSGPAAHSSGKTAAESSQKLADALPIVLITGLSGSGKSTALNVFEDMGFYRIDGFPSLLVQYLTNLVGSNDFAGSIGLVLGMDLRQSSSVSSFNGIVASLRANGFEPRVVFFDAATDILVKRYASTRRPHPLEKEGLGLEQALEQERKRLDSIKQSADLVIDTSSYSIHKLRQELQGKWNALKEGGAPSLRLHIISFGFKYGTPAEADFVFDLRFLPNPYFVEELKPLSGLDAPVAEYVLQSPSGMALLRHLDDFLHFVLKENAIEGRYRLTIAIGCTGGRHRSVATAEAMAALFSREGYALSIEHRHLDLG
jgi:Predicted P-loop-containing kinase